MNVFSGLENGFRAIKDLLNANFANRHSFDDTAVQAASFAVADGMQYVPIDASAGTVTATLPLCANSRGRVIVFANVGASGTATMDGNGSEEVRTVGAWSATSFSLTTRGQTCALYCPDGTYWIVLWAKLT